MKKLKIKILSICFSYLLVACGGGGSEESSGEINIVINAPPVISGTPNTSVIENNSYSFLPTTTDSDGDTLLFSIEGQPSWSDFDSATGGLSGTPGFNDAGSYSNIVISVTDHSAKMALSAFNIEVINNNRPPSLTNELNYEFSEAKSYTIQLSAEDPDSDPITISINTLPSWASFDSDSGSLTLSPSTKDAGTYSDLVVTLNDDQGARVEKNLNIVITDSVILNGYIIDDYISGAIVYLDTNNNGSLDSDELSVTTNGAGEYQLILTSNLIDIAQSKIFRAYIGEGAVDIGRPDKDFTTIPLTLNLAPIPDLSAQTEILSNLVISPFTHRVVEKIKDQISSAQLSSELIKAENEVVDEVLNELGILSGLVLSEETKANLIENLKQNLILGDFIAFTSDMIPEEITNEILDIESFVNNAKSQVQVLARQEVDKATNTAPIAEAGEDTVISLGQTVNLNGVNSSDADDNALTYIWTLSSPQGSNANLNNSSSVMPFITPDIVGDYAVSLVVNDGIIDSDVDVVNISVIDSNVAPVANAGVDQSANVGALVSLDGSNSSDVNNDILTYLWSLQSPNNSNASLSSSVVAKPTFTADIKGTYVANLVVNDGTENSQPDTVTINVIQENRAPTANAGADSEVETGGLVTLDGSASSDLDNDPLTYKWSLTKPNSSNSQLSDMAAAGPTFTPDIDGEYIATLIVNDGIADSEADSVTVVALTTNQAPVSNAGADQSSNVGALVSLDGSKSSDVNNDILTYLWSLQSPNNSNASLSSTVVAKPTFTADVKGTYVASLVVHDGTENSQTDTVTINVIQENRAPTANAGADSEVETGSLVTLDGSASSDLDNDPLTYKWSLTKPNSSNSQLSDTTVAAPTFTPDIDGEYIATLIVNDGAVDSEANSVTVVASTTNQAPMANAGGDQTITTGLVANLSGVLSSDNENDTLTYNWVIQTKPTYSEINLTTQTDIATSITPDIPGEYIISLIVNDGKKSSLEDLVIVTAVNNNVDITDDEFVNRNDSCTSYVGTYFSNVSDIKNSTNFTGSITITAAQNKCTLVSNSIPNHDFNDSSAAFASNVAENSLNYNIPAAPVTASAVTELTLGTTNVITLNGVEVDILPAACYNEGSEPIGREKIGCNDMAHPWRYDPMSSFNNFGTDQHNAHPQPSGLYHYHGNPMAMFDQECDTSGKPSPVIGFAADGYPVYGLCFTDPDTGSVRKAISSYGLKNNGGVRQDEGNYLTPTAGNGGIVSDNYDGQFRNDWEYVQGNGDLDECNGMEVDGQYGYYITNTYPWVLNCFKGEPDSSFIATPGSPGYLNKAHSHGTSGEHTH